MMLSRTASDIALFLISALLQLAMIPLFENAICWQKKMKGKRAYYFYLQFVYKKNITLNFHLNFRALKRIKRWEEGEENLLWEFHRPSEWRRWRIPEQSSPSGRHRWTSWWRRPQLWCIFRRTSSRLCSWPRPFPSIVGLLVAWSWLPSRASQIGLHS